MATPMLWETREVAMSGAVERLTAKVKLVNLAKKRHALDWSPKANWVEKAGGLPPGIESMAIHIMESSGLSREQAIPAAVNRAKKLAAQGKPRWIKEVAQWEALKAKSHAKSKG
jgi:hypothetical protein